MARAIKSPPSTVQGWMERGFIPPRRYEEVLRAAREAGIPLEREDFVAHLPNGAAA